MASNHRFVVVGFLALAAAALSPHAAAQGRGSYLNVESPQVSPVALATVGSQTVLLVCNTPNNSLEVWSTDETVAIGSRLLDRIRVGLEPVSVHVAGSRFWTANFLGDSVTAGNLTVSGTQVTANVTNTVNVGDEPMDVAYYDDGGTDTIFVTLNTTSAVAWLDGSTLLPRGAVAANASIPLVESAPAVLPPHGLKEPHAVRVFGGRLYALAFKGGVSHANSTHDYDVLSASIGAGTPTFGVPIGNLGSTNFNMRFASNGDLWAVGGEARNFVNLDKIAVRGEASGFVQSTLYRVQSPGTTPAIARCDVNLTCGTAVTAANALAMPTDLALYEVTGQVQKVFVAAFSSDRIGVFASATGTCSTPVGATTPLDWTRRTIAYPTTTAGGNTRWGPRGMALGNNQNGAARLYVLNRLDNSVAIFDPIAETFIDAFSMFDPTPAYVRAGRPFLYSADLSGNGFVSCASCHTDGRTDALSWRLGNPNGVPPFEPAPTQAFIWSLAGTGTLPSDPTFLALMAINQTFNPPMVSPPPPGLEDKHEMVTQSLQGLSNSEVTFDPTNASNSDVVRRLFQNAPFHWRGDKPTLREFNEAFVTLLGGPNIGTTADARGLTAAQMDAFEGFVHSIHYPPNPKQPRDREFSATGAAGLVEFHERPHAIVNQRSCVQCHALPEGSNNRLTVFVPESPFANYIAFANRQPIESAALRGLLQKEPLLEADGTTPNSSSGTPVVGHFGLNHNGVQRLTADPASSFIVPGGSNPHTSINLFIDAFFGPLNADPLANTPTSAPAVSTKQFVHEFDWGVAPAVGTVLHVQSATALANPTAILAQIAAMETQANLANAGLAVWGDFPGQTPRYRGWRYHPPTTSYPEEPLVLPAPSLAGLAAQLLAQPQNSLTFVSVPLGSERRIASVFGSTGSTLQFTPSNVALLGLFPNTAYDSVPSLRNNWVPPGAAADVLAGAAPFVFLPPTTAGFPTDEVFAKTMRLFQYGLLSGPLPTTPAGQNGPNTTNTVSYGLPNLRHEAPRRIFVIGDSIVTGARLLLGVPYPTLPYTGPTPQSVAQGQGTIATVTLELPLHPTSVYVNGRPVWGTAVELDPLSAYTLCLGGPRAPGVQDTIDYVNCSEYAACGLFGAPNPPAVIEPNATTPTFASPFSPDTWNWHGVRVRNPGPNGPDDPTGPVSTLVWQQLVLL